MLTLVPRMSTRFHCDLVSEGWIRGLAEHVRAAIAAHDEYETTEGDGVVYSEYNEERYMGPLSVVKYWFRVDVNVGRSSSTEDQARYDTDVEYCPETSTFRTRYETIDTKETRRRKREDAARRKAAMEAAADKVREHFEGREAIYVEKLGVLHVRVINIEQMFFRKLKWTASLMSLRKSRLLDLRTLRSTSTCVLFIGTRVIRFTGNWVRLVWKTFGSTDLEGVWRLFLLLCPASRPGCYRTCCSMAR